MPFRATRTLLSLQDYAFNFDELTELADDSPFTLELRAPRPYELHKDILMAVTIEMNPDLLVLTRNNYTVLDVLSEVGGLGEVLFILSSLLLKLLNYNHLTSYLASKLFKAAS